MADASSPPPSVAPSVEPVASAVPVEASASATSGKAACDAKCAHGEGPTSECKKCPHEEPSVRPPVKWEKDFFVCIGLVFLIALVCGTGIAVIMFLKLKDGLFNDKYGFPKDK